METEEGTEKKKVRVNAVSINETAYYNIREEDKSCIKEIRSVYAYNPETRTHLCELTPSHYLEYLYTYIIHTDDVSDDKVSELDNGYCYEPRDGFLYMHVWDVRALPMKKECGEFDSFEEACEYLRGNCPF